MDLEKPVLSENERLSEALGCPVDVMDFSGTPTGTHKWYKAQEAFHRRPGPAELIAITSGNYGAALKWVAERANRRVHLIMDVEGRSELARKLQGPHSTVVDIKDLRGNLPGGNLQRIHLDRPGLITDLSHYALETALATLTGRSPNEFINVTSHTDIVRTSEYTGTALSQLRDQPIYDVSAWLPTGHDYQAAFVPTGGGELLYDTANAFVYTPTSVFGVCPSGHPLVTGTTFAPENFEASYADKLICPTQQMDGLLRILQTIMRTTRGGHIDYLAAEESEFRHAHHLARKMGLDCEPSGAAACVALIKKFRKRHRIFFRRSGRVLMVNTGNGQPYLDQLEA